VHQIGDQPRLSVKVSDLEAGTIQLRQHDNVVNLKKGGNTEYVALNYKTMRFSL